MFCVISKNRRENAGQVEHSDLTTHNTRRKWQLLSMEGCVHLSVPSSMSSKNSEATRKILSVSFCQALTLMDGINKLV